MTASGYEKLQNELKLLVNKERPEIIAAIAEARTHGDLSENAEYQYAKEQQSLNEGKIAELETTIAHAEIIDVSKLSGKEIKFGATVKIEDEESGEESTYQIVGEYVKDNTGVGVSQIPVSFTNNTPNYGILENAVVYTNNLGTATNTLSSITTSSFDFENNTTDNIEINVEAIGIDAGGFETLYTATSSALIIPQSLQNIWQVDELDVYFAQQLNIINNVSVTRLSQVPQIGKSIAQNIKTQLKDLDLN